MKDLFKKTFLLKKFYIFSLVLVVLLLFVYSGNFTARAAVAIDGSSRQGEFDTFGVTTLSFTHSVGLGTSRALFVSISTSNTTLGAFPGNRVTSVNYNSLPLTRIGSRISSDTSNGVEIFRLINPPSAVGMIEVNLAAVSSNYVFASAISFTGVEQSSPNGTFFSATGTSDNPIINVTDSASGDLVLDAISSTFNSASFVQGMNQTVCTDAMDENTCRRGRSFFGGTSDVGASSIKNENGSLILMNWTLANSANWAIGAFAVKAVPTTSASGEIRGRVFGNDGRSVARAVVSITGSDGEVFTARTNPFGYFRFSEIQFGASYVVQVNSKQFVFAPQIITFNDDISELIFTAIGK